MQEIIFTQKEECLNSNNLKLLINNLIDANLNVYKLQELSEWVHNYNFDSNKINEQTKSMIEFKKHLSSLGKIGEVELILKVKCTKGIKKVA